MTKNLLDQGGVVHDVLQNFARSLKHFVQSGEYLEQRHLHQLLKDTQRTALALKDRVKASEMLEYTLELTSSQLQSYSQWQLHDPSLQAAGGPMTAGGLPAISLESIEELVAQSEIDFRLLKANIRAVLERRSQASIAAVLEEFPATQGLGSVVGLVALGSRHGDKTCHYEIVAWMGGDEQRRSARIPTIYFLKERSNELV